LAGIIERIYRMLSDVQIVKVVNFLFANGHFKGTTEQLYEIISKHNEYNTLEVVWKNEEVLAVCRYNIDHTTVAVIDATVRKYHKGSRLLKLMLLMGLNKFPNTRYIKYMRGWKVRREERVFPVDRFLNLKEKYAQETV
jgi:hypothetical protein